MAEEKAELDATDHYGLTPRSTAARYGRAEIVRLLVNTGRVNLAAQDSCGRTPLWYAIKYGDGGIVNIPLMKQ